MPSYAKRILKRNPLNGMMDVVFKDIATGEVIPNESVGDYEVVDGGTSTGGDDSGSTDGEYDIKDTNQDGEVSKKEKRAWKKKPRKERKALKAGEPWPPESGDADSPLEDDDGDDDLSDVGNFMSQLGQIPGNNGSDSPFADLSAAFGGPDAPTGASGISGIEASSTTDQSGMGGLGDAYGQDATNETGFEAPTPTSSPQATSTNMDNVSTLGPSSVTGNPDFGQTTADTVTSAATTTDPGRSVSLNPATGDYVDDETGDVVMSAQQAHAQERSTTAAAVAAQAPFGGVTAPSRPDDGPQAVAEALSPTGFVDPTSGVVGPAIDTQFADPGYLGPEYGPAPASPVGQVDVGPALADPTATNATVSAAHAANPGFASGDQSLGGQFSGMGGIGDAYGAGLADPGPSYSEAYGNPDFGQGRFSSVSAAQSPFSEEAANYGPGGPVSQAGSSGFSTSAQSGQDGFSGYGGFSGIGDMAGAMSDTYGGGASFGGMGGYGTASATSGGDLGGGYFGGFGPGAGVSGGYGSSSSGSTAAGGGGSYSGSAGSGSSYGDANQGGTSADTSDGYAEALGGWL